MLKIASVLQERKRIIQAAAREMVGFRKLGNNELYK